MPELNGLDAGFVYSETADQPLTCPCLFILRPRPGVEPARPITLDELRAHVASRLPMLPMLRWRLARAPLGMSRPFFVEDPAFDLEYHVRQVSVPAPGGRAELDRLVADGAERRLDLRHPGWQMSLIDGLADGSQAVEVRVHHAMVDGLSMITIAARLFSDGEPTPGAVKAMARGPPHARAVARALVRDAVADHWRGLGRLPGRVKDTSSRLEQLKAREQESSITVPALGKDTPTTPLNNAYSNRRVWARGLISLDDVRFVRRTSGLTVDAVMLAVASGSLRAYLSARGDLPEQSLTANVPVLADPENADSRFWGNRFGDYLATLATDEDDPWARLLRIGEVAKESRQRLEILGPETIVRWLDYVPSAIGDPGGAYLGRRRRQRRDKVSFSVLVSNVPGPSDPLAFGPVEVEQIYASGPTTDGEGVNITAWSSADRIAMTVLAHAEALDQPQELVDGFSVALAELVDAGRAAGRRGHGRPGGA